MQAGKVGINVAINGQVASWFDDHAHFASSMKVPDNSLDGGGMTLFGIVTEAGNLTDGKSNVGTCVGGEIQEHTNNRAIAPGLIHWESVRVDSESQLTCRCPIGIAGNHAGGFFDLVDESFLSECERTNFCILGKFDAEEICKCSFSGEAQSFRFEVRKQFLQVFFVGICDTEVINIENNHYSAFVKQAWIVSTSFEPFFT